MSDWTFPQVSSQKIAGELLIYQQVFKISGDTDSREIVWKI